MKHLRVIQTAACAALVLAAFFQQVAWADEWNDRTVVTFSNTVQVPGTILPAGTYVFKVLESSGIAMSCRFPTSGRATCSRR
jgi:hypothetical protein